MLTWWLPGCIILSTHPSISTIIFVGRSTCHHVCASSTYLKLHSLSHYTYSYNGSEQSHTILVFILSRAMKAQVSMGIYADLLEVCLLAYTTVV